jgi:lipopolysaccharide export LptBFGC system permease protein LptF
MQVLAPYFEAMMMICFGISWPVAIAKTLRTRNVAGMSLFFLVVVELGYLAGILSKLLGRLDWVVALYIMNFLFVATEITLYLRYSKPDRPAPSR